MVLRENLTRVAFSSVTTAHTVTTGTTFQAAIPEQILTRTWTKTNNWTDHVPIKIFHLISSYFRKSKITLKISVVAVKELLSHLVLYHLILLTAVEQYMVLSLKNKNRIRSILFFFLLIIHCLSLGTYCS